MPAPAVNRRGYLDWLRGLAVIIMITAHILDSWTRYDDRHSALYGAAMFVAGMGAPLFLFLAGVSVSLSAASKLRRTSDHTVAAAAVVRRGLQIFGLAFLFRLQACILSWGPWRTLLKVDILNIMGPSIMAAAALWGWCRSRRGRCIAFAAAALAIAFVTPPVRAVAWLSPLPDPIEGYIRPRPGLHDLRILSLGGVCLCRGSARRPDRRSHGKIRGADTRHSHCACRHRDRRRCLRCVVPSVPLRALGVLDQLAIVFSTSHRGPHRVDRSRVRAGSTAPGTAEGSVLSNSSDARRCSSTGFTSR